MLDTFGIELEFGSKKPDLFLCEQLEVELGADSIYFPQDSWNISEDFSASDAKFIGMELRSPKFDVFPQLILSSLLAKLRALPCVITPTSGLHFHFSGPSFSYLCFLNDRKLGEISAKLLTLGNPSPKRLKHCGSITTFNTKASALRQLCEDHWECRVFDSTFEIEKVFSSFEKMLEVITI